MSIRPTAKCTDNNLQSGTFYKMGNETRLVPIGAQHRSPLQS
jgi:hypothetical protein